VLTPTIAVVLFAIAAALAVAGQLLVLRDALAGRTPAAGTSLAARGRELVWIAVPAILLALVLLATWRSLPVQDRGALPVKGSPRPSASAWVAPAGR
jgi:hypothetical protein